MAVTIYSTPTCTYCHQAKEYFKQHAIEFVDYDVAADQEKAREMVELSNQMGVPVILVPEDIASTGKREFIVGFDRNRLATLLSITD